MRRVTRIVGLGLGVAVLVGSVTVLADTLVLKSGRRVNGELRGVRDGVIEFVEEGYGSRVQQFDRRDVARIELDDSYANPGESLSSGTSGARPRGLRERQVVVLSMTAWNDTGVDVRNGQTVYIESKGRVRWGPKRTDGAAGERNSPTNAKRPIPNRPAAALIGKIGAESSDYFFIGDDKGPLRMQTSGRLFLGINDDYLQDNDGGLRVTVYY